MVKAFNYRLEPTPQQATHLNGILGSVRFVYNLALDTKLQAYTKGVSVNCFDRAAGAVDAPVDCLKAGIRLAL